MSFFRRLIISGERVEASEELKFMLDDVLRTKLVAILYEGRSAKILKSYFSHGDNIVTTNTVYRATILLDSVLH